MEEKNLDLLLTPSAKKNSKFVRKYPFPIITSECKENEEDPNWKIAEGYLQETCVAVYDEESMERLYSMGFFGKGSLSKNAPKVCFQKTSESKKQKQRTNTVSPVDDIIDVVDSDEEGSKSTILNASNEDELIISVSSDSDEYGKDLKQSDSEDEEFLELSFQEAFFLSYGLGCLVVKDKYKFLNLSALWIKLCELRPNFAVMYTAYHHFRSKGWIVRDGLKFGTDYVLYKDGPPFYHATYSVIVQTLKENLKEAAGNRDLTWSSLSALNRMNNTAGKGLLILYVIRPNSITFKMLTTPLCISHFKLEEVIYKRWVAEENRESNDPLMSHQLE